MATKGGEMKKLTSGLGAFVALTLLAPLVAAGTLVWRSSSRSPLESAAAPEPTVVAVESATRSGEANVSITVRTADAFAPRVQASGLMTAIGVEVGSEVVGGQVVAAVDGAELVAYQAAEPLWQDATVGAPAPVVRLAQTVLQGLGYYAGEVDGRWGPGTRGAITAFNAAHGYGRDNPVLSVASLVWIGEQTLRVASLDLRAGDPVAPGDALFTTDAGLVGIEVTEPPSMVAGAEYVFEYAGTTVPYTPGSGLVTDPVAVAAIVRDMGTLTEAAGTLRLAEPLTVGTVPSSAVVTGPTGTICVFADTTGEAIDVTPLSGSMGTVDLDPSLIGTPVLVNPREVRTDLSCG